MKNIFLGFLRNFLKQKKSEISNLSINFNSISLVEKTPAYESLKENDFIQVNYKDLPYWLIFKCPSGCGQVISLSLQKIHNPHWTVFVTKNGRPTVYPSIWQNTGCYSHFWIKDGKVYFCENTGTSPF